MNKSEFDLIMIRLDEIEQKIKDIDPPGHFFIIVMLIIIMQHIGAC